MTQPTSEQPTAAPPRRRRRWPIVTAAVVLLAGGAATGWFLLRPSATPTVENLTRTVQAETSTQTVTVGLAGTLTPRSSAALSFAVPGTVTDVYVTVGDQVTKGQKLARVDDDALQDALELAEANLDTAEANLDDVEDNGSTAAVNAAKAQVRSAKAAVSSAEDDLDDAVLRSTIDGTVAALDLTVGDTVASGGSGGSALGQASGSSAQVTVISTAQWKLEASVGSADLAGLAAGQPVVVSPDSGTSRIDGVVASVGIVATATNNGAATFPVVVELSGEHPELYSGTTAAGVVTVAEFPDVLTIPTAALSAQDGKPVVTKLVGDRPVITEVTTGRVFGEATEITAGLVAGDQVQITIVRGGQQGGTQQPGGIFGGGFGGPPDGGGRPSGEPGQGASGSGSSGSGR